jgi:asparagine synthase (glutamine-hydrolysing)
VDSSLVAALAQENLGSRLKTYTVGFEDSGMSEAGPARAVAQHLGTDHHEIPVSASSVLNDFEGILAGAAEPIGDDSYVPTHLISRETRRHVTVALSGDGGDELFAGYEKYRQFARALRLQVLPLPWALLARGPWNDRVWKSLAALATPSRLELARWLSTLWKRAELPGLVCSAVGAAPGADAFEISWNKRPRFPELEQWMLTDMETYLEGDILTKVDRASMAASLEARSPFLDSEVIEQTLQWPCHAHLNGGGKAILKTLLAKRLPEQLFARPKQGFGMPVDQWFRGPLRGLLERYTAPRRLRRRGLLCSEVVRRAVEQHLSGRRNFARRLYAVVAFEIWADVFFGEETALA